MGIFRDIFHRFGAHELPRRDREYAAHKKTGHSQGCNCTSCSFYKETAKEGDLYDQLGRRYDKR